MRWNRPKDAFRDVIPICFGLLAAVPANATSFASDILPLLSDRCFSCHGPDAAQRQAGLRLDQRRAVLLPAESGQVPIKPGDPGGSELLRRVESREPAKRMPPSHLGHDPLEPKAIEALRDWIREGAEYDAHWAFSPPKRPSPPALKDGQWPRNPVDAFVLRRLDSEGLSHSPASGPANWLRRMTLDLNGLPPALADTRAFIEQVARRGEPAYENAVDRALASPRYGERMAVDWLDVARYADTHGFNNDSERSMWPWRDWVIGAFNRNLSYDRFIVEQLAGDLLRHPSLDQRIATGFNRNHVINSEGGIIEEEYRVEYVADRVRTLGMAWLGLTIECARCHDHKYDPISQRDYYRLFALFNNQPELGEAGRVANAVPMIAAPTMSQRQAIESQRHLVARLELEEARTEESWNPTASALKRVKVPSFPPGATFQYDCADSDRSGIFGLSCGGLEIEPPSLVELDTSGAFTLALWLRAEAEVEDAPLFSAIDYAPDAASAIHGAGIQLRRVSQEIELRLSHRYPSYSITVRSAGAGLKPGQWRHVTALYDGSDGKDSMRAKASWVRLFVDGREVRTEILHDDLQSAAKFQTPFRIGLENGRKATRFDGRIDEIAIWSKVLNGREIERAFTAAALPWALTHPVSGLERAWLYRNLNPSSEAEAARRRLFALERNVPTTMVMRELAEPRPARILVRGRYDQPGEPVKPGVPESLLGPWPAGAPANRLGLALWLTRSDHPTSARVVVNRFWQQVFGVGLVKTSEDLGVRGDAPSHPDLLDWLAIEFVDSGWDVKRLMKTIVLSAAYRQASDITPELLAVDPENRLLARGSRFRLPAEAIRDLALEASGLLSYRVGGPSARPYQPEGLYEGIVVGEAFPGTTWKQGTGEELYRRSVYTFWKRTVPHPAMTAFDAPDREICTARRSSTNTPIQALTLMNAPTFTDAARHLAAHALRHAGERPGARTALLFELATGRRPKPEELQVLLDSLAHIRMSYRDDPTAARDTAAAAVGADADPAAEVAAYTALASLILNLDEVITKG